MVGNNMTEDVSAENNETNAGLMTAAFRLQIVLLVFILSQALTGLGRVGYTFDGWALGVSHQRTAEIGLLLAIAILVLIIKAKPANEKMKGMAIGMVGMWVIQFGLGEMMDMGGSLSWLGMIHAPLALMMFAHASMMMMKFKSE
jgi:heme A synthase